MRNLSFPHGDGRTSEESSDAAVCPTEYHVTGKRTHRPSISMRRTSYPLQMLNTASKKGEKKNIVEHIVEHRARIMLTTISLAFLGLFLLVIYRQFGIIVFVSTLSIILMPAIGALIYAKKLKIKEKERARQRELNRSSFRRGANKAKNVQIFTTDLEAARLRRSPTPSSLSKSPDQQQQNQQKQQPADDSPTGLANIKASIIPPKYQQTTNSTGTTPSLSPQPPVALSSSSPLPSAIASAVSTAIIATVSNNHHKSSSRPKLEHRQSTLQKITIQVPPSIRLEETPSIDHE